MTNRLAPAATSAVVLTLLTVLPALSLGVLASTSSAEEAASASPADSAVTVWPQWRGPGQDGVAPRGEYPVQWSPDQVAWSVATPGDGGSSPVVSGETAYLTAGVDGENRLYAYDLGDGSARWSVSLGADRGNKHRKGSGANPSPVTDGEVIAVYFRSGDLAGVTDSGEVLWQVNLQDEFGEDTLWWDLGSSPVLVDGMVVVAVMQTGPSYLVAYDLHTGERRWKVDRQLGAPEEAAQSYTTPQAVTVDGKSMIAVMGADHLTLHRAGDGSEVAKLGGFNPDGERYFRSISSPVAEGNLIVCPYARGATLTAVRIDRLAAGAGEAAILWHRDDLGSDVPTPAMHDGVVYVVSDGKRDKGTVYALAAESGETLWSVTMPRTRHSYSSSPLIAGGRLYVTGEDARTSVIGPVGSDAGEPASVLHTNEMADDEPYTVASPVPTGDGLLIRTNAALTKVAGSKP